MADMHQQVDFLSHSIALLSIKGKRSVFGHGPFRPILSKQLISSLRLLALRERFFFFFFLLGFNPVYYLAWQTNALILLTLFYPLLSLFCVRRSFCCSLSFIEAKSSDCVSYIIFIISSCHNLLTVVLSAMGL